jgi:hypothetical protein
MSGTRDQSERAIREPQWTVRIVTILILVAGAVIVAHALTRPEARRERAVGPLAPGDTASAAAERLGASPTVCGSDDLTHLLGRFPHGWSGAAQERAVEWLEESTVERWVYPLNAGERASCAGAAGLTEVGIGADGRLVWILPLAGRKSLLLPDTLQPGTFTDIPDA